MQEGLQQLGLLGVQVVLQKTLLLTMWWNLLTSLV